MRQFIQFSSFSAFLFIPLAIKAYTIDPGCGLNAAAVRQSADEALNMADYGQWRMNQPPQVNAEVVSALMGSGGSSAFIGTYLSSLYSSLRL